MALSLLLESVDQQLSALQATQEQAAVYRHDMRHHLTPALPTIFEIYTVTKSMETKICKMCECLRLIALAPQCIVSVVPYTDILFLLDISIWHISLCIYFKECPINE